MPKAGGAEDGEADGKALAKPKAKAAAKQQSKKAEHMARLRAAQAKAKAKAEEAKKLKQELKGLKESFRKDRFRNPGSAAAIEYKRMMESDGKIKDSDFKRILDKWQKDKGVSSEVVTITGQKSSSRELKKKKVTLDYKTVCKDSGLDIWGASSTGVPGGGLLWIPSVRAVHFPRDLKAREFGKGG
jgi:hypothetical protein